LNRLFVSTISKPSLYFSCGVLLVLCLDAMGATTRTSFNVNVTVQAVANVQQTTPGSLIISSQDIERGYVEVAEPVGLRISSNSMDGYALDVLPVSNLFSHVVVRGLGGDVALGVDGGRIVQRWHHAQTVSVNLKFQFALQPDAQPGEYAFPLQMTVRPL